MTISSRISRRGAIATGAAVTAGLQLSGLTRVFAQDQTVKVGWVKALSWTPWAAALENVKGYKVDLVPFGSSNEELVALTSGSIDMAPIGYNNVAALLANSDVPAKFVAGISGNSSVFLVRKGSNIKSWDDVKGKKVGCVRGSTQYVNLVTAAAVHHLDVNNPNDMTFVSIQNFTDLNLALQQGNCDAICTFPPLSEQALQAGYAERVPAIQKTMYDGSFFVASGIVASDRIIKNNPTAVQAIIDAFAAQMKYYSGDHMAWVKKFEAITGSTIDPQLLKEAADEREFIPYINLNQKQLLLVASTLYKLKVIPSDTGLELLKHLDYTFLAKATKQTPQQLGQS